MALKISLFYDIISPHSWVFYQALQQKLPVWQKQRQFSVDYLPVNSFFIHKRAHGVHPPGIIASKKEYMLQELADLCDFYNIPKGNFEISYEVLERRSRTALLMLNFIRRTRPEYYQMFLERMLSNFWHKSALFTHTSHLFKVGRELGVSFAEMENIVMHVEDQENCNDLLMRKFYLALGERITNIPWLRVDSDPGDQKLMGFTEIIRLELMDQLMAQTSFNPLNHNVGNPLINFYDDKLADQTGAESAAKPAGDAFEEAGTKTAFLKRKFMKMKRREQRGEEDC